MEFLKNSYAPNIPFTVVNSEGKILRTGYCKYEELILQKKEENEIVFLGMSDAKTQYVNLEEKILCNKKALTKLEDIPKNAEIFLLDENDKLTTKINDIKEISGKRVLVKSIEYMPTIFELNKPGD